MAKVSTERHWLDKGLDTEVRFNYDVNVSKDGEFSTTLPANIVSILESAKIALKSNRLGTYGYFTDKTFDGLCRQVGEVMKEYSSKEIVSEKIIIRYAINTVASYALDVHGNIWPNAGFPEIDDTGWRTGTNPAWATNRLPYGLQVYCEPIRRVDYLYRSGTVKTEYLRLTDKEAKAGEALQWLVGLTCISDKGMANVQEIEYDEKVASFFVQLLKSICGINETIKNFLDPVSIKAIAETGGRLLN